jgi:hypothetical protein
MTHCTEDDLILHYYGEAGDRGVVEQHLGVCARCSAEYRALEQMLELVSTTAVPDRDAGYAAHVWQRLRGHLESEDAPWWKPWIQWRTVWLAAAAAAVMIAAFVAGRMWPYPQSRALPASTTVASEALASDERVRLAALGDHLERSERVLLDLVNADGDKVDLSAQQTWAAELVDSNRLYRDAAVRAGDGLVAGVLDDLERNLLDIVHGPSTATPAELETVRSRVDAAALLFKVRVLADDLQEREAAPVQLRKTI